MAAKETWRAHLTEAERASLEESEARSRSHGCLGCGGALLSSALGWQALGQMDSAWNAIGCVTLGIVAPVLLLWQALSGSAQREADDKQRRLATVGAERERKAHEDERRREAARRDAVLREEADLAYARELAVEGAVQAVLADLLGTKLPSQYHWLRTMAPLLFDVESSLGVEAAIVILLSQDNTVRAAKLYIGDEDSVWIDQREIMEAAAKCGARKVVMGHVHPSWSDATPSDPDVQSAATAYWTMKQAGLHLVDDLVICRTAEGRQLKSVLRTRRFRDLVREY